MTVFHPSDCDPTGARSERIQRPIAWRTKLTEIAVAVLSAIGFYAIAILALLTAQGVISF